MDYQLDDITCPKCGANPVHSRTCSNLYCDDGYETDETDGYRIPCDECHGTGIERWCPVCSIDMQTPDMLTLRRLKEIIHGAE